MLLWERVAPSFVGKGGFAPLLRLSGFVGAAGGFFIFYQRSIRTSHPTLPMHHHPSLYILKNADGEFAQ